jgi:hypothetical protein
LGEIPIPERATLKYGAPSFLRIDDEPRGIYLARLEGTSPGWRN